MQGGAVFDSREALGTVTKPSHLPKDVISIYITEDEKPGIGHAHLGRLIDPQNLLAGNGSTVHQYTLGEDNRIQRTSIPGGEGGGLI